MKKSDETAPDLDALEALEKRATPGPWRRYHPWSREGLRDANGNEVADAERWDDGELIVALRNAAPALITLARRWLEVEALVAADFNHERALGVLRAEYDRPTEAGAWSFPTTQHDRSLLGVYCLAAGHDNYRNLSVHHVLDAWAARAPLLEQATAVVDRLRRAERAAVETKRYREGAAVLWAGLFEVRVDRNKFGGKSDREVYEYVRARADAALDASGFGENGPGGTEPFDALSAVERQVETNAHVEAMESRAFRAEAERDAAAELFWQLVAEVERCHGALEARSLAEAGLSDWAEGLPRDDWGEAPEGPVGP